MFGAPGSNSSRKKQSGTTEYPTAKQLFSYMVSELLEIFGRGCILRLDNQKDGQK